MYSRVFIFTILLIALTPFEALADSASQTDWSGGPDVWGPVTDWSDLFYLASTVEWNSNPGSVVLQKTVVDFTIDDNFDGANCVHSADIDDDGDMDVVGAANVDNEITWWENVDDSGSVWTEHIVDTDYNWATHVHSEDIDDDGDMDILGAANVDNDITWWENVNGLGSVWIEHTVDGNYEGANCVYSADIDGDGSMDILGAARLAGNITWWENTDGSGTSWVEHIVDTDFLDVVSIYSEDIDSDGDMDVLGASVNGDAITWWENTDGSGTSWVEHTVAGNFDGAHTVRSGDINGDGKMDILGGAHYSNKVTWWENVNGSGTSWGEHTVDSNFFGVASVYTEDMDNDGDIDVIGAAEDCDNIAWWENTDGSGTNWTEHIVDDNYHVACFVYSADINGDGNMDILGACLGDDLISWWDITGQYFSGSLESTVFNTGTDPYWDYLDWSSVTPSETSVSFQVRASDNYTNMGAWSDTLTSPCALSGILNDGDRYVQYRTILNTSDPDTTPRLNELTISWNPLGIEDAPSVSEYMLFGSEPNPASGSVAIGLAVPEMSLVELSIYDLSGRLVITPVQNDYSPGIHQVQLGELSPGIYFCRMRTIDFTDIQRFAVID